MDELLQEQLKKYFGQSQIPKELVPFLNRVSETYVEFEKSQQECAKIEKKFQESVRQLEEANHTIEEKNKALQEAVTAKDEFIRIATHQINTPLSIMNNAYSMMEKGELTPKEGIEYWGRGVKRLSQIVSEFWGAFQSDSGTVVYAIYKSNIEAAIKEAVEERKKILVEEQKEVQIAIQDFGAPVPQVFCNLEKMKNVIANLLDNAINYTPKGTVTILYEIVGDKLKISFKDTGIGFSEFDLKKLGQKFYRGAKATLAHPDGSGLGLYVCRGIVEANAGKLEYHSDGDGKGAIFSFTLPIAK